MMVILLGALLVFGGVLYMVRTVIWRGSLSGPDSGRPVRGTLEPRRRGVGFLGLETNWPGFLLVATGAILLLSGSLLAPVSRRRTRLNLHQLGVMAGARAQ